MGEFSVDVSEMANSPEEDRGRDGFAATRFFMCAWTDRGQLRDELLAFPGHQYPHANIVARCTGVACKPFHQSIATVEPSPGVLLPTHEYAMITAKYESLRTTLAQADPDSADPGNPDMISESLEPSLEAMSVADLALFWDSLGVSRPLALSEKPNWMHYRENYTFVRHHLPSTPTNLLETYCTTPVVNNSPLVTRLLGITFPPETLLLIPPTLEMVANSVGARRFTVTYKFAFQGEGWNKFPRYRKRGSDSFVSLGYDPVYYRDDDGVVSLYKPYTPVNYDNL